MGAAYLFVANLKPHSLSDRLAHFFGNTARRHARGQTARFQHIHLREPGLEESRRNPRGFARAGLGL
jgi:hypothetical protein